MGLKVVNDHLIGSINILMDNLERVKRNAGLIKESDTAPIVSSYKTDLAARNWIVTPDQAATIRNSLDILVPLSRSLSEGAQQLSMDGMLSPEEVKILRQATELLK